MRGETQFPSSGIWENGKASEWFSMFGANALSFLQCFDNTSWVTKRASGWVKPKSCSLLDPLGEENEGNWVVLVHLKMAIKWGWWRGFFSCSVHLICKLSALCWQSWLRSCWLTNLQCLHVHPLNSQLLRQCMVFSRIHCTSSMPFHWLLLGLHMRIRALKMQRPKIVGL